jgi:hypothetical protein
MAVVFEFYLREAELGELFSNVLRIEDIAPRMGIALKYRSRVPSAMCWLKPGVRNQIDLAGKFAHFLNTVPFFY